MYAGVDIGATKTAVASFDAQGTILKKTIFGTPTTYPPLSDLLHQAFSSFNKHTFRAVGVGACGTIDRKHGIGKDFANLTQWLNVPLETDLEQIFGCPAIVDNDANVAGLGEAVLLPSDKKVLYITISTGIGTGFIDHHQIVPDLADSEGGQMLLEYHGKLVKWESFASGRAIVERFGKRAEDIHDETTWRRIAHDLSLGLIELMAIGQPDIVVFGGSVGNYAERFLPFVQAELKRYENPLIRTPQLRKAARPEEAVLYGCYELAKAQYGRAA